MPWPSEDDEFDDDEDESDDEMYDEGESVDDDEDDDFDDEDEGDCGLNSDGTCEWIGTEDCDECPYHPA
jgi:hypothetical protein